MGSDVSEVSRFRLWKQRPGRVATKWSSIWNADYRRNSFRSHLLTAEAHGGATQLHSGEDGPARIAKHGTPLVRASAPHGVSGSISAGSHLGSTLNPGGAVLTLGVSRRSRSVAYIRADASPSEVLAKVIVALGAR